MPVPLIDLFAGPGGLGEGFSACNSENGERLYKISLSIEKDYWAHQTLELRSFFRQFPETCVPDEYYQYLRGEIDRTILFEKYPDQASSAQREAWNAELGKVTHQEVDRRINTNLGNEKCWVLVGGPPCQAFSTVGRSRMRRMSHNSYVFEKDHRHFLYLEYLRILRQHSPPVFIMENVKGLLSAKVDGASMFEKICRDLTRRTTKTPGYHIHSFVEQGNGKKHRPGEYTIQAEHYGVPQMRHRVILLGIRKDLNQDYKILQQLPAIPTARDAIQDLPRLRSSLSQEDDSFAAWFSVLEDALRPELWNGYAEKQGLLKRLEKAINEAKSEKRPYKDGPDFTSSKIELESSAWLKANSDWFLDSRLDYTCNHSSRSHMRQDLMRYLFASTYAAEKKSSPFLRHFPERLLPEHQNVHTAMKSDNFADRFRVQVADRPATTVVSHIAKDGHYYIHYDPSQCRSLTVREVARLQTFPDNYFFEGSRTQQYYQVGNAVPPLLARQLAEVVHGVLINNAMI